MRDNHLGIVGSEAAKFTSVTERAARLLIRALLSDPTSVAVSGHCHLGGIDVWVEEEAAQLGRATLIYPPRTLTWPGGFKPRNRLIAKHSAIVHCVTVLELPPGYAGRRFSACYHCEGRGVPPHVKSGGCWTAWRCPRRAWHIIQPDGTVVSYQPGAEAGYAVSVTNPF